MKGVLTAARRMQCHCSASEGPEITKGHKISVARAPSCGTYCAHSHESPLVVGLEEVLSERAGHGYGHREKGKSDYHSRRTKTH
jgi:hypothetical protein